jgi:hypothetical protein
VERHTLLACTRSVSPALEADALSGGVGRISTTASALRDPLELDTTAMRLTAGVATPQLIATRRAAQPMTLSLGSRAARACHVEVVSTSPAAAAPRAPQAATSYRAPILPRAAPRAPRADIARALEAPAQAAAQRALQADIARALAAPAQAAAQRALQADIARALGALAQARVQAARAAEPLLRAPQAAAQSAGVTATKAPKPSAPRQALPRYS